MLEQLRSQLDKPNYYRDALRDAIDEDGREGRYGAVVAEYCGKVVETARPIVATKDHEEIAIDVAHAIKPEIDQVVALERQKKAHNPLEGATYVEIDGQMRLTGTASLESEYQLMVAKADLERNAKNASEIAAEKHLDASTLDLVNSQQEVANWRRV